MALRKYDWIHLLTYWIFWHVLPTVEFRVKWPTGMITVDPDHPKWDWTLGAHYQQGFSADPNDHYRPWLEKHVGRQGWAWDWELSTGDLHANTLTIRIRRDKAEYASIASLRWT